jgi:hypothetical protein
MLGQLIWWSGIALEILLLVRGFRGQLVRRLPVFYGYITFVLLQEFARLLAKSNPRIYWNVYWLTEFLGLALGSLVIFEIYKVSLRAFPGAARMARNALAFVFLTAVAKGLANVWASGGWRLDSTAFQIERALRTVQATAILALVALFLVYSIPFGRNLRGILLGYGIFIGQRVICLTFMPPQGHHFWFYAYSAGYLVTLVIWVAHLWSYEAIPVPETRAPGEGEYQTIAAATQRRLRAMRASVRKAVRS